MQFKPTAAIIVLSLLVASLFISGCTTSTTNQTPTSSTATHDAFLDNYLAAVKKLTDSNKNWTVKAWEVTWINSTSARLQDSSVNNFVNHTWSSDATYIVFPTTQDATNYLNAMSMTAYSVSSTPYESGGAYDVATGHAPQIYQSYVWKESPNNVSEYKYHEIAQLDNLITTFTGKYLSYSAYQGAV